MPATAQGHFGNCIGLGVNYEALFHVEINSGGLRWEHVAERRVLVRWARIIRQFQESGGCGTYFLVGGRQRSLSWKWRKETRLRTHLDKERGSALHLRQTGWLLGLKVGETQ